MASEQIPKTVKQWNVEKFGGFNGLTFSEQPLPELSDNEVLVKLEAASLNYRDLIIARGEYPHGKREGVVPGSDGAGTVVAIGKRVSRFQPGDKVVTMFNQGHIGGDLNPQIHRTGTGGMLDGVLRTYGAFNEHALVRAPSTLTARESSTLSCAALTAWNALYGSLDHVVKAGQWVLVQGHRRLATLKKLGADHVISYKEDRRWGETARKLTGGRGVDIIVQVAGVNEMEQSIEAIKMCGVITIIGFLAGRTGDNEMGFQRCLAKMFTARPVFVGSRVQMEEMVEAIEAHPDGLRPVIDERVFKLEEFKEAYEYQWTGKHFSKVVVEID
ncbi:hypothetical protein ACSS6W_004027 [Trichoderma asperelloides]